MGVRARAAVEPLLKLDIVPLWCRLRRRLRRLEHGAGIRELPLILHERFILRWREGDESEVLLYLGGGLTRRRGPP